MAIAIVGAALATPSATATVPTGFTDTLVAAVATPTAVAFTSDGRILVTSQVGTLHVVADGTLVGTPALTLGARVCSDSERGLLGVAVDPAFATNHFVYLYYTAATANGCVNRVSRFLLSSSNLVDVSSETILIDGIPSPAGNHNGGDLHFGKDGYLYASVGDGGCDYNGDSGCAVANDAARDLNVLVGKILRITSSGGIPADNPFAGSNSVRCNLTGRTDPGKVCQETYSWGLRNPFRIAFDPNASGTRFYINDVGQSVWEEIDVGQAGADYGWNVREGFCAANSSTDCGPPPSGMTNPIYAYAHIDNCNAITAGAFVPRGVWPAAYDGAYLFSDYLCGKIWRLVPSGDGFAAQEFATDLGSGGPIAMMFGPAGSTQALYYTTYANGGQLRRIEFTPPQPTNQVPTAVLSADVTSGSAPLTVHFDGGGSSDPDAGDSLTYVWDFGDGSAPIETSVATATHQYSVAGTFTATLAVRDNHGATSDSATVKVEVGPPAVPPSAVVVSTITGTFRVGNELTATTGTWTGSEAIAYSYQWVRCDQDGGECVVIAGATESTYMLAPPDFGETIRVVVTMTNAAGSAVATSLPTPRIKHACSGDPC